MSLEINTYPLFKEVQRIIENNYTRGDIVEIGAGPQSTPFFFEIASKNKIRMCSVDVNMNRLPRGAPISCYATSGELFLKDFDVDIFFCYMDNYDWMDEQGCTKIESERVHLEQSELLITKMVEGGIILFDDTGIESNTEHSPEYIMSNISSIKFYGKGATAIPFLLSKGMKIIGYSANRWHGGFIGEHDQVLLQI